MTAKAPRPVNRNLQSVADVHFIIEEVVRFAHMTTSELFALDKRDHLNELPHPNGSGNLICGHAAGQRLSRLAEEALAKSALKGRVVGARFRRLLAKILADRFIGDQRPIDEQQVARALAATLKAAQKACSDLTHYLPCHITSDEVPDGFAIGPVIFWPRRLLMERMEHDFEKYRRTSDEEWLAKRATLKPSPGSAEAMRKDAARQSRMFTDDAVAWLNQFGWVAEVTVKSCDAETSRERAVLAVDGALNVLRVVLGEYFSDHIRLGGTQVRPARQATLVRGASGDIDITLSLDSVSNHLGGNWWDIVVARAGENRLNAVGIALSAIVDARANHPLSERLIDGLSWFGQAVTDSSPASRIVKYTTAVERMTVCGDKDDVTEIIAQRGAALCYDPTADDLDIWRGRIRQVYSCRSDLVHGTTSPFDPELERASALAENVARFTLIRGLDFFAMLGLERDDASVKRLTKAYDQLVAQVAGASAANRPRE